MGQILRQDDISGALSITSATTAQMFASASTPFIVTLGGRQYRSNSTLNISTAVSGLGGLDTGSLEIGTYYLFLAVSSGTLGLIISLSTTPTGVNSYKQIGRVRVGINESSAVAMLDIRTESQYQTEITETKSNYVINGAFDYWQRNSTFSTPANGAANADRFKHYYDGAGSAFTISRQAYSLGQSIDGNPKYYHRTQVTTAGSGGTIRYLRHAIEGVHNLAGKVVTLSFYAAADNNRTLTIAIAQLFGTGGSPSAVVTTVLSSVNITASLTKYSLTFRVPSVAGKTLGTNGDDWVELQIRTPINTTMTIDIGQIMINDGAYAAPFALAGGDVAGELILCQRYYEKSYNIDVAPGTAGDGRGSARFYVGGSNNINTLGGVRMRVFYKVQKRGMPNSITIYSWATGAAGVIRYSGGVPAAADVAALPAEDSGTHSCTIGSNVVTTNSDAGAQWAVDAEL